MNLGSGELIIILLVVLLVFGGAKLPQLARSLGQAKVEFEKGSVETDAPRERTEKPPAGAAASAETGDTSGEDPVTLSRSELDELVEEKVRERTDSPAPDQTTGSDSGSA